MPAVTPGPGVRAGWILIGAQLLTGHPSPRGVLLAQGRIDQTGQVSIQLLTGER